MKKYIFRREKLLSDGVVGMISGNMIWPVNADGCEAFFPDGEKQKGHTISRTGNRLNVYPEWVETVEDNEGDTP